MAVHACAGLQIPVFPTEPTSAVAFLLTSQTYHEQQARNRREALDAVLATSSVPAHTPQPSAVSGLIASAPPSEPGTSHPQTPRSTTAEAGTTGPVSPLASIDQTLSPPLSLNTTVDVGAALVRQASAAGSDAGAPPLRRDDSVGGLSRAGDALADTVCFSPASFVTV